MLIHDLVKELGERLHTPLALDDAGLARIMIDDFLAVDFELDAPEGRLLVYSVLGPLPMGSDGAALAIELLAGNLFGSESGPCSPAYDRERNELLLWFSVDESAQMETLLALLENLVGRTEQWLERIARGEVSPDAGRQSAEAMMPATASMRA